MQFDDITKRLNEAKGYLETYNIEVIKLGNGYAEIEAHMTERDKNPYGAVHGGVLYTLADNAGGIATGVSTEYRNVFVTVGGSIRYFKMAKTETVRAVAREVSRSNRFHFYEIELFDQDGVLVAKAESTFYDTSKPISDEVWEEMESRTL